MSHFLFLTAVRFCQLGTVLTCTTCQLWYFFQGVLAMFRLSFVQFALSPAAFLCPCLWRFYWWLPSNRFTRRLNSLKRFAFFWWWLRHDFQPLRVKLEKIWNITLIDYLPFFAWLWVYTNLHVTFAAGHQPLILALNFIELNVKLLFKLIFDLLSSNTFLGLINYLHGGMSLLSLRALLALQKVLRFQDI